MLFGLFGNDEKKKEEKKVVEEPKKGTSWITRIQIATNALKILSKNCSLDGKILEQNKEFIGDCAGLIDLYLLDNHVTGKSTEEEPLIRLSEISKFLVTKDEAALKIYRECRLKEREKNKKDESVKPKEEPEPKEEKKEEVKQEAKSAEPEKKEEKIDPQEPANIGLKTKEDLLQEIVEIKKDPKKETIKPAEPVKKAEPKPEVKAEVKKEETVIVTPPPAPEVKKEEVNVEQKPVQATATTETAKPSFMVTYADQMRNSFSDYEKKIFDKVIKKLEDLVAKKGFNIDIKLVRWIVKNFSNSNKLVSFVFVNDNKEFPLIEVFYDTSGKSGRYNQKTNRYRNADELINAMEKRREEAKADPDKEKYCYNLKREDIPGYVAA